MNDAARWAAACGLSVAVHLGLAIGGWGWGSAPSIEVKAGAAKVTLVLQSKQAVQNPIHRSWNHLKPTSQPTPPTASIPDREGVISTAPYSLHNPPPPYPPLAFQRGIQGVTSLRVEVGPDGKATQVVVERSSGSWILDEAAAGAVWGWRFMPARQMGRPVSGTIRIRIRFQIVEA